MNETECIAWRDSSDAYAQLLNETQVECLRVTSLMIQLGEALKMGVYGDKSVTMETRKWTLLSAIEAYEMEEQGDYDHRN